MVLGNMDIGLNTANLAAIVIITLLTLLNTFGVKLGASVQNVFTSAKVLALAAVVLVGLVAKNAIATAANFGTGWHNFWAGASWHTTHAVQVGVGGPTAFVGLLTVVAVVQVGSLFSADAWNNVTFTASEIENPRRNIPLSLALGTGVVLLLYIFCNFVYLSVLPLAGSPEAATIAGRGIQFATQDRVATAVIESAFGPSSWPPQSSSPPSAASTECFSPARASTTPWAATASSSNPSANSASRPATPRAASRSTPSGCSGRGPPCSASPAATASYWIM
jgi:APA family basic amino acid/polyamine antiporter